MVDVKRSKLKDSDIETLNKIFLYGGYTTAISLKNYLDIDISNVRRFLYKLVDSGYLISKQFYSNSDRDVVIYQVTGKTCRLFDNPDSHYRKKHNEMYIIRALVKQHLLFQIAKYYPVIIIPENPERMKLLSEKLGFNSDNLPRKYNGSDSFIHIEEYLLDLREKLPEKNLHEIFKLDLEGIAIIYIDKYQSNPSSQLFSLINKYKKIMAENLIQITFVVIVDSEIRERQYKDSILRHSEMFYAYGKVYEIPQNIINLHLKILEDNLGVGLERLVNLDNEIRKKYSVFQNLNNKDLEGIPIKEISVNGIKSIQEITDSILNATCDIDERREKIRDFFSKIYKIYATGLFQKDNLADVKVIKIDYKFSL